MNTQTSDVVDLPQPAEETRTERRSSHLLRNSIWVVALCVFAVAKAHAQDPLTSNAASWTSTLTGGFAKSIVTIGILLAGAPMALGQAGDHKAKLTGAMIGGALVLGAQQALSYFGS